ncbi:MAG: hypothetical protein ACRDZP_06615, partial [Acidimicrobiales bacterium]
PGTVTASLVGASYVAFCSVVLAARRKGGVLATCGCFGTPDTPPTLTHAALNLGIAAASVFVAATAASSLAGSSTSVLQLLRLEHSPLAGVPLLAAAAVSAWLLLLGMSSLARLSSAGRW